MPRHRMARVYSPALIRRWVPDALSVTRMISAPMIPVLVRSGSSAAAPVLLACGLTDILDGYLARRWGIASDRGARLDSAADVVFFGSITAATMLALPRHHRRWVLLAAAPIGVMRIASLIPGRTPQPAEAVHSASNRTAGLALGIGAWLVVAGRPAAVLAPGAIAALVGAAQDLRRRYPISR